MIVVREQMRLVDYLPSNIIPAVDLAIKVDGKQRVTHSGLADRYRNAMPADSKALGHRVNVLHSHVAAARLVPIQGPAPAEAKVKCAVFQRRVIPHVDR